MLLTIPQYQPIISKVVFNVSQESYQRALNMSKSAIFEVGGGARKTNKDYTGGTLPQLVDIIIEEKAMAAYEEL